MRTMRHPDGSEFFKPHKLINKDQIKSLFGRMSQLQRARKLKEPKEMDSDQLQCDIPTEIIEPDQSNEIEERVSVVENYFKLEVNHFVYVSLVNERKKKSFSRTDHYMDKFFELTRMILN